MYTGNNDYSEFSVFILKIIGGILLLLFLISSSQSCSRDEHGMIYIQEGYCYDENTNIIYVESFVGRYDTDAVYVPYYNSDGDMCKYDVSTGDWLAIED